MLKTLKQTWNNFATYLEQLLNHVGAILKHFAQIRSISTHSEATLKYFRVFCKIPWSETLHFPLVKWSLLSSRLVIVPDFLFIEAFSGILRAFLIRNLAFSFLLINHFSLQDLSFSQILNLFEQIQAFCEISWSETLNFPSCEIDHFSLQDLSFSRILNVLKYF